MIARLTLGLALLLLATAGRAATVQELLEQGHLQVSSEIVPAGDIVARQKLALVLEVATDRWFAGGTRIRLPEVAGLVILQTEQFAANASEYRDGASWVVQRWTLDVYPQQEGDFTIPAVALEVKVNAESGVVEGSLQAPGVSFSARRPAGLEQAQHWVAAPRYAVTQTFDRALDELQVGDAVERKIRFEADDVMAMMLPTFEPGSMEGLAIYPEPPQLQNRSNRGVASASRVQRVSYLMQVPGSFTLPAQDFYWWDTTTSSLQLLSLPAVELVVGGSVGQSGDGAAKKQRLSPRQLLPWLGAAALLLVALLALRKLPAVPWDGLRRRLLRLREAWRALLRPALPERLNPGNNAAD